MIARRLLSAAGIFLALTLVTSSCDYLKDKEPWTATVQYRVGDAGELIVEPLSIQADSNRGLVQVVNDTPIRRGFAVPELAVFEEVPPGLTITVTVDEARDGETYLWQDHLHKEDFEGEIVVVYVEDEFRDR